jgi:hypothetical protein
MYLNLTNLSVEKSGGENLFSGAGGSYFVFGRQLEFIE